MENKNNWSEKFFAWTRNKQILYPVVLIIVILLILAGLWVSRYETQLAAKKAAELQQQKAAAQLAEKLKNTTYSRPSFFLSAPVGARGAFNVPSYIEGDWRMSDTFNADKKMTINYVKNGANVPLMYVRYDEKTNFKLAAGEVELKTASAKYSYAYYFYPVDSYSGKDQADFASMQKDFQTALTTFGVF